MYSYYSSFLTTLLPFSVYYLICSPHYSTIKLSEEIIITLNTKTFAHKLKARSCLPPASYSICLIFEHVDCTLLTLPQLRLSSSYMCCDLCLSSFFFLQKRYPSCDSYDHLRERNKCLLPLCLGSWWVPFTQHYFIDLFSEIVNF